MLRAMFEVLDPATPDDTKDTEDILLYILREDARVISGHPGFVGLLAYTGPPNGGKTFFCNRLIALLGDNGLEAYCVSLVKNFFTVPARADAEASRPGSQKLRGTRYAYIAECDGGELLPDKVKEVLDPNDGMVNARANSSRARDVNAFPITWAVQLMRQPCITVKENPAQDGGMKGKIVEIVPPNEFVQFPEPGTRQKLGSSAINEQTKQNHYGGELLFWARLLFPTLDKKIAPSRTLLPLPKSVQNRARVIETQGLTGRLDRFLLRQFEHCDVAEAASASDVRKLVKSHFGALDKNVLFAVGLGDSHRRKAKQTNHNFYALKLGGAQLLPVKLRIPPGVDSDDEI